METFILAIIRHNFMIESSIIEYIIQRIITDIMSTFPSDKSEEPQKFSTGTPSYPLGSYRIS